MDSPCFKCRQRDGKNHYRRTIEKIVYCRREWLCDPCKAYYKQQGFTLKEEK